MMKQIKKWWNTKVEIEEDNYVTNKKIYTSWTTYGLAVLGFGFLVTKSFLVKNYILGVLLLAPFIILLFIPFKRRQWEAEAQNFIARTLMKRALKQIKKKR